ncbi:Hypothetical Protein FCC1311_058502 [Hondaea fermentalgiana]|uniref:BZIP domain-containing protein n=1 Tax=Hondaea fermentalgiana TaxID=2315210 RepID=A0A2R5GH09_9STRA|nr:Hypothetical Protein FCC1311_058502 [Hondaea fermentalgiana]|eukprot:GBG29629.1 Hypothetical Protein FCC1311_058502 [Hondaea fermentalgiana]
MSEGVKAERGGDEDGDGGGGGGGGSAEGSGGERRKRQRMAEQSRASREKRKRELEQLRTANRQLRDKSEGFRAKIKQLESQLANNLSSETVDMIRENSALRLQLQMHERFIQSFMKIASGPSSFAGQRVLCREGADAAQSYVRGLVAESLKSWKPLLLPAPYAFPIEDFQLHYSVTENFFGASNRGIGDSRRLNLRLDMSFPGVPAKDVAEYYWKTYQSAEEMDRLLSFKALELETVDVPDDDTAVMYNRKTWNSPYHKPTDVSFKTNDEDAVFIINRQKEWMPRSTLPSAPPASDDEVVTDTHSDREHQGLASESKDDHGNGASATACKGQKTTTSSASANVQHITSVIAQGAIVWYDDRSSRSRLVVVLSYPQNFRWLNHTFADVVSDGSVTGEGFAALLMHIGSRLETIFGARMAAATTATADSDRTEPNGSDDVISHQPVSVAPPP